MAIHAVTKRDEERVRDLMVLHWGSSQIVNSFGVKECDHLPGFWACLDGQMVGLITYQITANSCEVVSLDSLLERQGIGTSLMRAVEQVAIAAGCSRVWLITTNDNLHALGFYQKRGYRLVAIHRDAVTAARKIKPQIPLIGNDGIPILDEIELEKFALMPQTAKMHKRPNNKAVGP